MTYTLNIILIIFFGHWYLSLFTQSFFNHRYAAHQMFKMSKFWEKIFFILSWIFQGSSYLSPYIYGAIHRQHHTYADKWKDPHSPIYSTTIWKMMWRTKVFYSRLWRKEMKFNPKFIKDLPNWWSFEKIVESWVTRLIWCIIYISIYFYVISIIGQNKQLYLYFLLPIHFIMGPFHGAIINWYAHKIGYVNFKVQDTSKNLMPVDFLMLGEGFHNNHHANVTDPNFAKKWFEIDPLWIVIKFFDIINIIKLKK